MSYGSDVGSGAESGAEGVRICLHIVKLIMLVIFLLLRQIPVTLQEEKFARGHSYRGFRPLLVGIPAFGPTAHNKSRWEFRAKGACSFRGS